jgi:Ca-activated chloride channel homolog
MKYILIIIAALLANDPIKVSKINKLKSEAKDAFQAGDYKTAAEKYSFLADSMGVKEDEIMLNLAHSKYLLKDTANAFSVYQNLTTSQKKEIASKANQQLGIMANAQNKPELALNYFKQAIKSNPLNEDARYDYEMLKKKLDEKKKQEQQQQNQDKKNQDKQNQDQQNKDQQKKDQEKKDQENKDEQKKEDQEKKDQEKKDQQNKDQEQKEQEKKDQEQKEQEEKQQEQDQKDQRKSQDNLDKEKLEQMKISEEKARMILEAMKNQEKQYLQQNKRKATKQRDKGKPDW